MHSTCYHHTIRFLSIGKGNHISTSNPWLCIECDQTLKSDSCLLTKQLQIITLTAVKQIQISFNQRTNLSSSLTWGSENMLLSPQIEEQLWGFKEQCSTGVHPVPTRLWFIPYDPQQKKKQRERGGKSKTWSTFTLRRRSISHRAIYISF